MDLQEAYNETDKIIFLTEPDKLGALKLQELEHYYNALHGLRDWLMAAKPGLARCDSRMALLRREIELKRVEDRSDRQHGQAIRLGKWTLIVSAVAAIAAIGTLLLDIPFSKLLPVTSSKALPTSSSRVLPTAAPSSTPTATIPPLVTPRASDTPAESVSPGP